METACERCMTMSLINIRRFEIKKEHLLLLKRAYVTWNDCEFGAPTIDCKRPYGNSDVIQDMLEILGLEESSPCLFEFSLFDRAWTLQGSDKFNVRYEDQESLVTILGQLHDDTQVALQIALSTQSFETGIYECEGYSEHWRKVE